MYQEIAENQQKINIKKILKKNSKKVLTRYINVC